jgi:hypothetical protein
MRDDDDRVNTRMKAEMAEPVMLSEAKHLAAIADRLLAPLGMTASNVFRCAW